MNKELVKKYKQEFEHWLSGKSILWRSPRVVGHRNEWLDTALGTCDNDLLFKSSDHQFVINDEYIELRKAQADGKRLQYKTSNGEIISLELCNKEFREFKGCLENYSILDEPEFKAGDWVRDTRKGMMHPIVQIKENCIALTDYKNSGTQYALWKPQKDEWCVFWDSDYLDEPIYIIGKYIGMYRDNYRNHNTDEAVNNIAPLEFAQTLKDK